MGIRIIQGGMGVGVSSWRLARAVAEMGQLGVVSGTGLPVGLARRLELGDPGAHVRRALTAFPVQAFVERAMARHYIEGGKRADEPFRSTEVPRIESGAGLVEMTVLANFVEVWLAKEGHSGVVGVNYLEKMQLPTLASLLGAMMAGVDYVLMGAGIPRQIPGILDDLAAGRPTELRIDVAGASPEEHYLSRLDPAAVLGMKVELKRPRFLAIVSSAVLAMTLARKSNGKVDGFVVECPPAGGHNAPPRGPMVLSDKGEPVYGARDVADLGKIRELGLPFWVAGGFAEPEKLREAIAAGAEGVQVGTAFAFCRESGLTDELRRKVLREVLEGTGPAVFTDPKASPTGYPFKVLQVEGTLSERASLVERDRVCNVGYLRQPYKSEDGTVRYRCPAEKVEAFVAKGGKAEDAEGRVCLCNALFATIGLGQLTRDGTEELPVVTAGEDVAKLGRFLRDGAEEYSARDVVEYVLGPSAA